MKNETFLKEIINQIRKLKVCVGCIIVWNEQEK